MERENTVKQFLSNVFGEVRVVSRKEELWFCASDVAEILLYKKTQDLTDILDDEDKGNETFVTQGGKQKMVVISESGLYSAICSITKRNKERYNKAKEFKKWITKEVIPSIRKNDGYIDKQEELSPEELMAKALLVAQQVIDEKERKIKE